MTWLLLVVLFGSPVPLRVGFDTFGSCMTAMEGLETADLGSAVCVPVTEGELT